MGEIFLETGWQSYQASPEGNFAPSKAFANALIHSVERVGPEPPSKQIDDEIPARETVS